jgi:hypothetical protein
MSADSLKRLIVLGLGAVLMLLSPLISKLSGGLIPALDAQHALSLAGLLSGYLLQSGLKSALDKMSQNKALGMIAADAAKLKALLDSLKAAQALQVGQVAASSPAPGAGPSQA